jgi:tripartite-type tricarboxylate transporter receptor subunit TctC
MKPSRRTFLHLAACIAAVPTAASTASAVDYPTRPVRLVVGFAAGSAPDIVARVTAQALSERLGQQVIVDDRPGAGSNIGTEIVARAPPDGYTLLMTVSTNAVNVTLYRNLNFDFLRDFRPVAAIASTPYLLGVNPSFPSKTLAEFIAYARANPGKIDYASSGNGTGTHVTGELFKMMTGLDLVHVPYRGNYIPDLLAGQVQVTFAPMAALIDHVRAGKLRALAVTSANRVEAMPDIPAVAELVPGFEASGWYGLSAPGGTSTEIVERLYQTTSAIMADPDMKRRFASLGVEPLAMTPVQFEKFIHDEIVKWAKVIRFANIKAE